MTLVPIVACREEITVDQLVDVVIGNRQYKPCLYLYNKIDTVTIEEVSHNCNCFLLPRVDARRLLNIFIIDTML